MKKITTGVKPTGSGMHIGNYFGAVKPFIDLSAGNESYLFIADYHSLTSVHNGEILKQNKINILLEYFSLIPENSNIIIYEQSKIQKINDITWILSSVTPLSLMLRAHAFKDSQAKNSDINMATFNYPVLMTSDIITYDVDLVPVGKDQIQHIEFARDIAGNFNKNYDCEIFKLPLQYIVEELATIPGIDGRKMSKSYDNFIPVFASEKELKKKIMSIVTDDTPLELPKNPETCNVFALIKLFSNKEKQEEIAAKYKAGNYGYGHAKLELLDLILKYFEEPRKKYEYYKQNIDVIYKKLEEGNIKMNEIANTKYEQIKKVVGL